MTISFLRHAPTNENIMGIYQGQMDCKLSEAGIKATREKSENFDSSAYDYIYCSPLDRTRETARILIPSDREIVYDPRLMERKLGVLESTKIDFDVLKKLWNDTYIPEGAESMQDVDVRVGEFIDEIHSAHPDSNVLVITHGGVVCSVQRLFGIENKLINNLDILKITI